MAHGRGGDKPYRRSAWLGTTVACLLALTVAPDAAAAQSRWDALGSPVFAHIAQDGELPNAAFPRALVQDGRGFMWIGTENGLARWDGYRFRIEKPDRGVPGTLPDSVIDALATDGRGNLWIGTDSHGVVRYDPGHDRFVGEPHADAATAPAVSTMIDDGRGGMYAGTERGLERFAPADDTASTLIVRSRVLSDYDVRALLNDRAGTFWIGTTRGLFRRSARGGRLAPVRFASVAISRVDVRALSEDDDGRVWIATDANGVFTIEPAGSEATRYAAIGAARTDLLNASISSIVQPQRGVVWLGTGAAGIIAVDTRAKRIRRFKHDPNEPSSLPSDSVLNMVRDRTGLTWVATTRSISVYDGRQGVFSTVFGPSRTPGGLSGGNVRSVLPVTADRLWIAFNRDGAELLDRRKHTAARVRLSAPGSAEAVAGARALTALPNGDVLFGGYAGLARVHGRSRIADGEIVPNLGIDVAVRTMCFADGRLWFSGIDRGLWSLDAAGRVTPVRDRRSGAPLVGGRVTLIAPAGGSSLWLGTPHGLLRFDPRIGIVERIDADIRSTAALTSGYVTTVLTDRTGRLWVGTQGGGIDVRIARDGRRRSVFAHVGTANGLPNDSVDRLVLDRSGTVWASTDAGIVAIDPRTLAVRSFGAVDGLGIDGYWVNSGAAGPDGDLYFGGLGGMTVVHPGALAAATLDVPLVATEIRVGGKIVTGDLASRGPLVLRPESNSVSVEFAALGMAGANRYHYAYRLAGYDTDWTETDAAHRYGVYANLLPGAYHLSVRAADRNGVRDSRTLELDLRVLPAWHQTLLFRLVSLAAALLLVALIIRARTAYLRRRERELEREVAARTAQLHETQAQLEKIAYHDALTQLPNRRIFAQACATRVAAAVDEAAPFALVLVDLDGFKSVNDTLGHDAGDAVLVAAAERLRSAVRATDVVARLGGDEFALLLSGDAEPAEVDAVCERILNAFAHPIVLETGVARTGASLGAALCPRDGTTPEALYKSADVALYAAKRAGRNTWRWYEPATHTPLAVE